MKPVHNIKKSQTIYLSYRYSQSEKRCMHKIAVCVLVRQNSPIEDAVKISLLRPNSSYIKYISGYFISSDLCPIKQYPVNSSTYRN